jgi:hypothetical protein
VPAEAAVHLIYASAEPHFPIESLLPVAVAVPGEIILMAELLEVKAAALMVEMVADGIGLVPVVLNPLEAVALLNPVLSVKEVMEMNGPMDMAAAAAAAVGMAAAPDMAAAAAVAAQATLTQR